MQQATHNYQVLAKRFVTLPLIITIFVTCCMFWVISLYHTISKEIQHARTINHLLTQTASYRNQNEILVAHQVTAVLKQSPNIEDIVFYPLDKPQTITPEQLTLQQLFFGKYHGLTLPVSVSPNIQQNNKQLIGYMVTTLNLSKIRKNWFKKNAPLLLGIFTITLLTLIITLMLLKKRIYRLPKLQQASQDILNDNDIDISKLTANHFDELTNIHHQPLWLVEAAIVHLLKKQKQHLHQLNELHLANQQLKEQQLHIIKQNSSFQNTFNHEFKSSLSKITAGTRLLESQYVSAEQQDAVNMINFAIDSLNAKLNQLQLMNHLEKNQVGINLSRFTPNQLIQDMIKIHQPKIQEKNLELITKFYHADYVLSGDTQKITLILSSLLDNAVKFTDNGSITIISKLQHLRKSIRWQINLIDTGIGIDPQYQQQIFEPFFQIHPERKHSYHSQNIGLYLVKKLTTMMGGTITFSSHESEGSNFCLSLTLDDWDTHQQNLTLQGKYITLWHANQQPDTNALLEAGATFSHFTDQNLLLNHLLNHNIDVLLISTDISPLAVINFVQQIRESEQHHRVLIVYYYHTKFTNYLQELQIMGVDYLENTDNELLLPENYLEKLLKYIN